MGSSYAGNVNVPTPQTQNIGGSFSNASNQISSLGGAYGGLGPSTLPYAQATAASLYNNPYAGGYQSGANTASGLGQNAALSGYGTGQYLTGAGTSLIPWASSIMQTGFDPQNALYNQLYQQNQAQGAVNNAQAGVANSPYGAGVLDQSGQNFNINWQNNLLGRETQAANAAGNLVSTGAGVAGQGVNMQYGAPTELVQSAAIPYAAFSGIGQGQNQALNSLLSIGQSGANLSNLPISDLLSFIGQQTGANQVANQAAQVGLNQSQLGWNQLAQLGSGLGNLAGNVLNYLG